MEIEVESILFNPLFINTLQSIFLGSGEETAPRSRRVRSPEPRTLLPGAEDVAPRSRDNQKFAGG